MSAGFKTTISFTLDPSSISDAAIKVLRIKFKLDEIREELMKALVDFGVETAIELAYIPSSQFHSTQDVPDIIRSIQGVYYPDEEVGYVYSDLDAAVYLEYGTGIVGKENPHDGIEAGESDPPVMIYLNADGYNRIYTTYDTYEHGLNGWYFVDRTGQLIKTNGQPAGQFMYNTFVALKEKAPEIMKSLLAAKGVFR